jgi:putative transposase
VRYSFLVYGYVVMPNHIHLLISEPQEGTIANIVQSLKIGSAKQIKAKQGQKPHNCQPKAIVGHERNSPFWQARYYDRNVRDHDEFTNDLKYIHRNPVKRGLVEKPEDWPWSSYRSYALHEQGTVAVESPWATYKRDHPAADPNQLSRIFAEH